MCYIIVALMICLGAKAQTIGGISGTVTPGLNIVRGDANKDGSIDLKDVRTLQDILLKIEKLTLESEVNGDGHVSISDLPALIRMLQPRYVPKQLLVYRKGKLPLRFNICDIDSIRFEMPKEDPYGWVDLGLSVMWATCNVGASQPEEYGNYYAWGETETKASYTTNTYSHYSNGTYTKLPDNIANTTYDAAHMLREYTWRMPTLAEMDELATQCTWKWTAQNGVNGYLVVGPSGKSIFLPAAGHMRDVPINVGFTGFYWTATDDNSTPAKAMYLNFTAHDQHWTTFRAYGMPIRAVKPK